MGLDLTDGDFRADFFGEAAGDGDVFALADHYAELLTGERYASLSVERANLSAAIRSGSRMRVATAVDAVDAAVARRDGAA